MLMLFLFDKMRWTVIAKRKRKGAGGVVAWSVAVTGWDSFFWHLPSRHWSWHCRRGCSCFRWFNCFTLKRHQFIYRCVPAPCTTTTTTTTPHYTLYHCLYSSLLPSPLLFLHTQHFSDMVSFLDSAITCVIALICGIVLLWVVSGTCRTLTRKGRRKKKDRDRIDSKQVALLDPVVRIWYTSLTWNSNSNMWSVDHRSYS